MTPERWQRVKGIFQAALERAPSERSPFLASACGGDESLRREVESLLAAHEKSGEFIDSPAFEAAAELSALDDHELKPSQIIGAYEIVSFISRGGMGEVYLAHDRRLNRKVALKFLPGSLTKEADRLRRFEQEARAASALNHPNIITIYEIAGIDSTHVIATEFVEGRTLRQVLGEEALDISQALQIAIQIADALTAAHKAGIIHRDIKPENIMLRPDGYVKVLDFGLAKLVEPQSIFAEISTVPTLRVKTGSGVIMGTVGYMSPEQARGQTVDGRSDIFNLGAVLYEMVAGKKPFEAETPSDVFAAILTTEPRPLSQIGVGAPAELERIVTKALRKDREERYSTAHEMLAELKGLREELEFQAKLDRSLAPNKTVERPADVQVQSPTTTPATDEIKSTVPTVVHSLSAEIKRHKAGVVIAVIALVAIVIVGAVMLSKFLRSKPPANPGVPQVARITQLTFSTSLDQFPALSAVGNSLAYSSDQSGSFEIYVKQLTPGGRDFQLTADGYQNLQPAWSPDGQRIAYVSLHRKGIWLVPAFGGTAKQLVEFGSSPAWSTDGSVIVFQSGVGSQLGYGESRAMAPSTIWAISSAGGKARQITQPGIPTGGHSTPKLSPDGKRIAFQVTEYGPASIWQISIDGSSLRKIADSGGDPIYDTTGQQIYVTRGRGGPGLSRIRLSSTTGEPLGAPEDIAVGPGTGMRNPAMSADGKKIAYTVTQTSSTLWSISLSGKSVSAPAPFARDTSLRNTTPRFSHDGKRVAISRSRAGAGTDIWLVDANGKNETQLTTDAADDISPNWFPNDDRIAFVSTRQGKRSLWAISVATGKEERLLDLDESAAYAALSPDGAQLAFNSTRTGTINMWIALLSGGEPRQLTFSQKDRTGFPSWSPDGQFLAFLAAHGDQGFVMVMPAAGGAPTQLTVEGASFVHSWSPDGEKLGIVSNRNGVWNVYSLSRVTKEQKQLTNYTKLNAYVRYCDWSPLGNQMVYEYAETRGNIWLMELK